MDILGAIGNTSLVRLHRVVAPLGAEISVKLEWENPTGSVKDRMAQAVIVRAEGDGRREEVPLTLRLDTAVEVLYYRHGGIMPYVLRQILRAS